jgi:hypothetical protein
VPAGGPCAGGIGTYGSEGFELCGFDLERDAHKAVVEWITGDRVAYARKKTSPPDNRRRQFYLPDKLFRDYQMTRRKAAVTSM